MKGKHPKSVDALRAKLIEDEAGRDEYVAQRTISAIGGLIERSLHEQGRTQSDLARAAQMHQPDLNALIRGNAKHVPTVLTMRRLAAALNAALMIQIEPTGLVHVSLKKRPSAGRRDAARAFVP